MSEAKQSLGRLVFEIKMKFSIEKSDEVFIYKKDNFLILALTQENTFLILLEPTQQNSDESKSQLSSEPKGKIWPWHEAKTLEKPTKQKHQKS